MLKLMPLLVYCFLTELKGMRDPLSDSKLRLSKLRENCSWVTIEELDAGNTDLPNCMVRSFSIFAILLITY